MSAADQLPYLMTVAELLDRQTPDGSDRWALASLCRSRRRSAAAIAAATSTQE
jgi:hypothetical protein